MFGNAAATFAAFAALATFPNTINGQDSPALSPREAQYAPFSDIYFIKERNVGSGKTEVHVLDHGTSYSTAAGHYATVFDQNEWPNGNFQIAGGNYAGADLFYIKVRNTGSGKIELHRATARSGYKSFSVQTPTAFELFDGDRGTWSVDDGDLYFIKTRSTGSGNIEVHRASRSDYLNYDLHQATSLPDFEADNGTWTIVGKKLYFIKYRNTRRRNVEVHILDPSDGYQEERLLTTWFNIYDADNGTWDIGANGDLYFIKTTNAESGKIEVHVATASSKYQDVSHYASWVSQADGANGEWSAR